jgi:transmembrane sensor
VPGRERAESTAAEWIARRESGLWTEADQATLDDWIASSLDNRVAWLRLSSAWQETHRLKTLYSDAPPGVVPEPNDVRLTFFADHQAETPAQTEAPTHLPYPTRRGVVALAAVVLLVCFTAVAWKLLPTNPAYETDIGAVEAVPLADGSRVTLNTDTRIKVDLTENERRINLARGEAYFEVARDPSRPFVVRVGNKRIVAVGTRFSVRRDPDGVRVFVTEGTVRVEQADAGEVTRSIAQLQPGNIAHAVADGVVFQTRPVAEVEQLLTWRTGYLVFDHTPLDEAVAEFNRYNRRKIVIRDPQVAAIRIGGNFRTTNMDAFLRLVESDFPITAAEEDGRIILTGASPAQK